MRVDIPQDATGEVGFLNEGWWGMNVGEYVDKSLYSCVDETSVVCVV
jgi:hypothetical protein